MSVWDILTGRDSPARVSHIAALSAELQTRLGSAVRVIASFSERELYARDLGDLPKWLEKAFFRTTPHLVVQPIDPQQIAAILQFSIEHRLPVVPRGIASTAFGGPVPTNGGIVIDLSPMKSIGSISIGTQPSITVQAGARFGDIEERISTYGYTLPVYPSNRLGTVAGWITSGGYGVNALKYGHVRNWVEAIEVATMTGAVRWVMNDDPDFADFIGTEGQMGIITQVTLRLLPQPDVRAPHLLSFDSTPAALEFAAEIDRVGVHPATITFVSTTLLRYVNELHQIDHPHCSAPFYLERPSLVVYCDEAAAESELKSIISQRSDVLENDRERAGSAWADRYFPLKIRRLGPALLAAQLIMPIEQVAAYLDEANRYAAKWGLTLATEAHVLPPSKSGAGLRTLTMPMFLTDQGRQSFAAHFAFVPLLEHIGAKYRGEPYNLGIWHAPFANEKYSRERWQDLIEAKRRFDPHNLLNPGKFPRIKSRFGGLTGLLLQPPIFRFGMDFFRRITPFVALFTGGTGRGTQPRVSESANQRVNDAADYAGRHPQYEGRFHVSSIPLTFDTPPPTDLLRTAQECTSCGNCISVCPAYLQTRDERTTARGKLWLAKRVTSGKPFDHDESDMTFMCLRCRACSEVCQAQLPLMNAWEQFESMLATHYGRPDEKIEQFLSDVERNPEYAQFVGLRRPGGILTQSWLAGRELIPLKAVSEARVAGGHIEEDYDEPIHTHVTGGKFHIATATAPSIAQPIGKYHIERSDFCVNCGQCAEACVYGVHYRSPIDLRRMNHPDDHLCRACFRCVEECPRQALSISSDATYASFGQGPYTADVVASLARQADEGRIPVTGAGYRGRFAGDGFDGMWTDMS